VRGFYRGLNLGPVEIASAVAEGLDYYLLLGIAPDASDTAVQAAYWRHWCTLPPNKARLPAALERKFTLLKQAGTILGDSERRRIYDQLRATRRAGRAPQADEATRGMALFRAGRFDDAARLLRQATRQPAASADLHLHYALSLLYGCANLASIEDWRIAEMLAATEQASQLSNDNRQAQAHHALFVAIDHYDKQRVEQAHACLSELHRSFARWHLPWLVSAFWSRHAGDLGAALAHAERARQIAPDDKLLASFNQIMRRAWATAPDMLPRAARRAALLLADGTSATSIVSAWR
jgi:curved DNA-binding protein CbpA